MLTNSERVEIVTSLYKDKGWSLSEFARKLEMPKSSLSRYLNKNRQFPINKADLFANVLNTSIEYLLGLEDDTNNFRIEHKINSLPSTLQKVTDTTSKLEHKRQLVVLDTAQTQLKKQTAEQNTEENSTNTAGNNVVQFPTKDDFESLIVHGLESAGDGIWQEDETDIEVRIPKSKIPEVFDDLALVIGDSMRPKLHNGDILFVTFTKQIEIGQIGVFRTTKGNFVKKLQPDRLESLNPDYEDIYFEEDEFAEAIGVVQDIYRK